LSWIKRELTNLGIPPLKRFGQHFLIDKRVRDAMVAAAELSNEDRLLEVGPGLGFLTAELVKRAGRVVAVEKDRTLAKYLMARYSRVRNLEIIQGDALIVGNSGCTKLVSSPPYNISSKLVLFITRNRFDSAVLLFQDEFVQRLTAESGSREYGRLSVSLQVSAETEIIMKVPRSAFYPSPRVDSTLVTIKPRSEFLQIRDPSLLEDLVRSLFTQRRRRLSTVLKKYLERKYPLTHSALFTQLKIPERRVFQMSPTQLVELANEIACNSEGEMDEG
jgi:16S rRNA (adenine1518-N6/adenine1519-N6)-dimethyltransferase